MLVHLLRADEDRPVRTVRDLVQWLQAEPPPDDAYLDAVEEIARDQPTLPASRWEH